MGTEFWWIFDALVIMIAAYIIYSNIKRGLTRVFVLNIGYVIAIFLSGLVALNAGPLIYQSSVQDSHLEDLEEVVSSVDVPKAMADAVDARRLGFRCDPAKVRDCLSAPHTDQYASLLYEYLNGRYGKQICDFTDFQKMLRESYVYAYTKALDEKLPRYVSKNFAAQIDDNADVMTELLEITYEKYAYTGKIAAEFEKRFCVDPSVEILRMLVFVACFSVIMIIVAVIASLMKNTLFFNATGASERFFGGVLGLSEMLALLILFTILVRLIVLLGGGETLCFNDPTIAESKLFSVLYNHLSMLI